MEFDRSGQETRILNFIFWSQARFKISVINFPMSGQDRILFYSFYFIQARTKIFSILFLGTKQDSRSEILSRHRSRYKNAQFSFHLLCFNVFGYILYQVAD
jgi:hypothetical protein